MSLSLGEQPHDPAHCDRGGQPHLGPCVCSDPPEESCADAGCPLHGGDDRAIDWDDAS